ncbi:MAG: DUF2496 domain-containing protein [Pseudoalteromonas sp.]|uniref:DUF2496 domain-containing protein n=1 Tax=unclassified Pseudoalteromonas TaxID=194690 RepID=UPI000C08AA4D|nr:MULTISPECIES: DUF2496 domain-containing protein [unclassified Pseudoalteromonas]MDP2635366.1 DUF2496 domain-containing protein [Pseudoalteromonas sp. 1_MG-2023]PHN89800.1 hypothetical protein CSC79_11085 [Pseudoalteromonas sp. 3D05]TGE77619.1 DUF2496 domain-containing protein [Pseudoalteromonas sp. KS88]
MSQALEQAPTHIKLAVDLIQLLEENNVKPEDVLKALEIIKGDYTNKLTASPT